MKILVFILSLLIPFRAFSISEPHFLESRSGHVKTLIIIDDTASIEIHKLKEVGELCNSYLSTSEFKDVPVFIWYGNPRYFGGKDSIFMSFDKGKSRFYNISRKKYKTSNLLDKNGLVIRIISREIMAETILQLLEFGLNNKDFIKENQIGTNYAYWQWKSLKRKDLDLNLGKFQFSARIDSLLNNYRIRE